MSTDWDKGLAPLPNVIHSERADIAKAIDFSQLKGRVVLITGGAAGFGAAIAEKAASHGANIIIGDINSSIGIAFAATLRKATNNANHHFIQCDVTSWSSQAAFFKQAAQLSPHKGIDVVIANAGIASPEEGERLENPPDYSKVDNPAEPNIMKTVDVNLKGVLYTSHLAMSYLPRNPGSKPCSVKGTSGPRDRQLILVSSLAGLCPLPLVSTYCTSKHGVVGLFRSLRVTAPNNHGIRVNMINPYFAATAIIGVAGQAVMAGGDMANVSDVVDTMLRFITDTTIIGRGLVVSPAGTKEEIGIAGLDFTTDGPGPVWDAYAHDWYQSDIFVRRLLAVANLRIKGKGRIGLVIDLIKAFTSPIRRLIGR